jgi:hypothetical protein
MNIIFYFYLNYFLLLYNKKVLFFLTHGDWGLGIGDGDWGLGIGPNPQSPIPNPNPQSPIPNPHIYLYIIIKQIWKIICYNLKE